MLSHLFDNVLKMGAMVIVLCGGFTACRDNASPDSASIRRRSVPASDIRKGPELKASLAWIGESHNKALDDLRAEMRKPGMLTNNVCEYLAGFAAAVDRLPEGKGAGRSKDRLSVAKSVQKEAKLCRGNAINTVSKQSDDTYGGISAIMAQIESEIDAASDRYDLARRLTPLWSSVGNLNESESLIVAAALITAQSSFEYWEVEVDRAYREFEAEYADCARTSSSDGYDYDQARQFCLDGGLLPTRGTRYAPSPTRIAGFVPVRDCRLSSQFKSLAKADVAGAFTGAIKGAMGGGLAGAGTGALTGAIVGSAGSWFNSAWELYKCTLK